MHANHKPGIFEDDIIIILLSQGYDLFDIDNLQTNTVTS